MLYKDMYAIYSDMYTIMRINGPHESMSSRHLTLTSKLRKDKGKQHHTSFVEDADTRYERPGNFVQRGSREGEPYREHCDGEEVEKQHKGPADDTSKQSDRTIDALAATLKVPKTTQLQSLELRIYFKISVGQCVSVCDLSIHTIRSKE